MKFIKALNEDNAKRLENIKTEIYPGQMSPKFETSAI